MPMDSSDEEEVVERGEKLPYDKYFKVVLPSKNTKFWFSNRYVVTTVDNLKYKHGTQYHPDEEGVSDGRINLVIYGSSDKYGHRHIELTYEDDHYLVKRAWYETDDQLEELLNELKDEIEELKGEMPPLYQTQ